MASEHQTPPAAEEAIPAPTERFGVALGWSFAMNGAQQVSTLITAFVLAGLLGPEAYGTVALALIFIAMLQVLTEQGVGPAVIQRPHLTLRHLDTAFWLTMSMSVVLCIAGWALSGWWAGLNDTPEAEPVIRALSVLVLARGLTIVQEALLERQLKYRSLALRTTFASVSGAAAGITFALIQPSLWALVVQQLVMAVVGVVVLWSVAAWRPRLRFEAREARELLNFAGKVVLSSIAVFVNTRVDAVLVGVYFGAVAVGLYRLSDRLVQSAIALSARPLQRVGLPEFARHQHDPAAAKERYRSLVSAATAIGASVMAIVFACAEPLMATLGTEWSAAVGALQLLCVVGVVRVVTVLNGAVIVGTGHPGVQAAMSWISAVLSCTAFLIAGLLLQDRDLEVQVVGMAASRAILYVVVLLPISQIWIIHRFVGVRFSDFLRLIAPGVSVSVIAALGGTVFARTLSSLGWPDPLALVVVGAVTAVVVVPANLALSPTASAVVRRLVARNRS